MYKKILIQFLLLITIFIIVFSTFFLYFNKKEKLKTSSLPITKEKKLLLDDETGTLIKDINYSFYDQAGNYYEDTGWGHEGHLVVVNDTRVTNDDAYSFHPSISVDNDGNTHIAWMDGRGYGFDKDDNYEVWYTRLRLRGSSEWNGVPGGLPSYGIKQIYDYPISEFEGKNNVPPARPWGPSSYMPSILADAQDNIHIAWLENSKFSLDAAILADRAPSD